MMIVMMIYMPMQTCSSVHTVPSWCGCLAGLWGGTWNSELHTIGWGSGKENGSAYLAHNLSAIH